MLKICLKGFMDIFPAGPHNQEEEEAAVLHVLGRGGEWEDWQCGREEWGLFYRR